MMFVRFGKYSRSLILAALGALALGSAAPGAAAEAPLTRSQTMTYQVYGGGINALTATVTINYGEDRSYHIDMSAWTRGFLAVMAPWSGSFETDGEKVNGENLVQSHKSVSVWRGTAENKFSTYKDGKFAGIKVDEAGKDKTPKHIDSKLTDGTTDILTATLTMLEKVANGGKCEGRADIYDGKRRYTLAYRPLGSERLSATPYNVFEGTAQKCEAEVTPGPGDWPKKPRGWLSIQEQGRQNGALPALWVAKLDKDGPAIPVKIRIVTSYGTLLMHLADYKNSGQ
jgi:hypothetical protein